MTGFLRPAGSKRAELERPLTASCAPQVLRRASSESGLQGDTLKVERVTDRTRESGSKFNVQGSKVEVRTLRDTVYVERRDSSLRVTAYGLQEDGTPTVSSKLSAVSKVLKWIFFIIIGLIGLIITVKVCSLRR